MRLLVDALFPDSVESEAPPGTEFVRWSGGGARDEDLVRSAAHDGYRGVVLFDRKSLQQPGLRELSAELGVALIAVEADDPVDAKDRLFHNLDRLRRALQSSGVVLLLSEEARAV